MTNNIPQNDHRYAVQQMIIDTVAAQHGLKVFRPDYHARNGDHNTVLLYTPQDFEYNKGLDKSIQCFSVANEKHRAPVWSFSNTNINNEFDLDYGRLSPYRTLDLRGADAHVRLEGSIKLAIAEYYQTLYCIHAGGVLGLVEDDEVYNDFNRKIIEYMCEAFGQAYIGNINYYGGSRNLVGEGKTAPMREYIGEDVYNFTCDFVVPNRDGDLEKMIHRWNTDEGFSEGVDLSGAIIDRIHNVGGKPLMWK